LYAPPTCQIQTGEENCQGTDDHASSNYYKNRFKMEWCRGPKDQDRCITDYFSECYDENGKHALEAYLMCPPPQPLAAGAAASAEATAEARACADKHILDEAPETLEARLSGAFCEPGKLVGLPVLDQMLATLDANRDGSVLCAEWGMAKRTSSLEQLGGAYHGPRSIAPPECPMTPRGAEALARYNAYLGELASATTARGRAVVDTALQGAAAQPP
jgi:hypothetical protein